MTDKTTQTQTTEKQIMKTASSYIIPADFPDPDVIRVNDTYYMVSTTMHFMPGCVILRSYNLVDWEHAAYVYDELEVTPGQTLQDNKGIYGKGMWAASLRYHNGKFYISFVANDTHKTYLYTSENIEGPWQKSQISGFYHDMSLLFDDDGKVYCVSGNTDITLTELEPELIGPKKDGINKVIIHDDPKKNLLGYEGSHFYKINGKYYIFMIHMPKDQMRTEGCYYSDRIDGPYTGKDVLCSYLAGWNSGTAQGGIVQANNGKWYSIVFQDHGALGRIPVLVPVKFEKDFPVFGSEGLTPEQVSVLNNRPNYRYKPLYSNDFTNPAWQWNHIPDKSLTSLNPSQFTVKTNKQGFSFNLKATNGEIIAVSEVYKAKASCLNGIASVKKNAPIAEIEDQTQPDFKKIKHPKFEVYTDKAGELRFRLKARNGEIIASSEGYKSMKSCLNGIESVKKNAPDSPIEELEQK